MLSMNIGMFSFICYQKKYYSVHRVVLDLDYECQIIRKGKEAISLH